jgi:hypothetical protein
LTFKNLGDQKDIRVPIPRRKGDLTEQERGSIVVAHASLKTKQFTFFLVQTDQGDLFKVTLEYSNQPDDVSVWLVLIIGEWLLRAVCKGGCSV